jgi:hypothetical protein
VELAPKRDLLKYRGASGYCTETGRFCVVAGSYAKGDPTPTLTTFNNGSFNRLRKILIENGVLNRTNDWDDYHFTKDYVFRSKNEATYIVAGNPRSSSVWR